MVEISLRVSGALIIGYGFLSIFSISVGNALIDSALLFMLLYCLLTKRRFLHDEKMLWLMALYCMVIVFVSFLSDVTVQLWDKLSKIFYYMLPPFLLGRLYADTGQDCNKVITTLFLGGLASVGYVFLQALQGISRAPGFINLLELAGQLSVVIPVMVVVATFAQFPYALRKIAQIMLFPAIAALILNGTRGAWLAVGVTCTVYVVWRLLFTNADIRVKKHIVASIVLLLVVMSSVFYAFSDAQIRMNSVFNLKDLGLGARLAMWPSATAMFFDNPLSGVGLGNFNLLYVKTYSRPDLVIIHFGRLYDQWLDHTHPHNSFLLLLAETGLIGAIAFCVLWGYVIFHFWRQMRTDSRNQVWPIMGLLLILSYFIFGLTENVFFGMNQYNQLVWLMLGLFWNRDRGIFSNEPFA